MMLASTAACGKNEQDANDMADNRVESSQAAEWDNTADAQKETAGSNHTDTAGINGTHNGTTGGNSTATDSDTILDDALSLIHI